MYIQEAVRKSLESGEWIQRKRWLDGFNGTIGILPTDTCYCCIIGRLDKEKGSVKGCAGRWNPHAEDLAADDWETAGWPSGQELLQLISQGKIVTDRELESFVLSLADGMDQALGEKFNDLSSRQSMEEVALEERRKHEARQQTCSDRPGSCGTWDEPAGNA